MNRARQRAVPARVLDPQEPGQAVLPLRGGQGLADGRDRDGGHHPDGRPLRRRAGPEGGPDHHHLLAPARVVLLLPVRAAAGGQAAGAGVRGHHRHPHHLPDAADAAAVLRPRPRAASAAPPGGHGGRRRDRRRHGLPDGPRRPGRPAERDRADVHRQARARGGRHGHRLVGLPGLPQDRRERQHARAQPDPHRRPPGQGRHRPDAGQPHVADAVVQDAAERTSPSSSTSWSTSSRRCAKSPRPSR